MPTRHWRTVGIDAIRRFSEMSPPSLRDAAIRHHCVATSAAHRARLVLMSTPVFGRNAQVAALTGALGERSISVPLLPFPAKSRQVKVEGGTAVRENTANASVRPEAGGAGLHGAHPRLTQEGIPLLLCAVEGVLIDVAADAWDPAVGLILPEMPGARAVLHGRMVFGRAHPDRIVHQRAVGKDSPRRNRRSYR